MDLAAECLALRALWNDLVDSENDMALAQAANQRAVAALNQRVADLRKALRIPASHAIDFLGDGTVKPTRECAVTPKP